MSLDNLCGVWACTLLWCNLPTMTFCFMNCGMNMLKLRLERGIRRFCVDLILGRKILLWFSHGLRIVMIDVDCSELPKLFYI